MKIINCIHTESKCYKCKETASPIGIVIHSTGCNQPKLSRYVHPSHNDLNFNYLIDMIGNNRFGNHWNRDINKSVHYFIGQGRKGEVFTVKTLPENICAWGVGRGSKGSYNYNPTAHIQIEICEDDLRDESYLRLCLIEAAELCADLCQKYNLSPNSIVSHREAYKKGYASNHSDIDHWLTKHKLTMNDFRESVKKELLKINGFEYIVVKGDSLWKISKIFLGSGFKYKELMEANGLKTTLIKPGQKLVIPSK